MATLAGQCTLRTLIEHEELALRAVIGESELPEQRLDLPVLWTHSTDLADPTPFLSPGILLLTTGTQLQADDRVWVAAYVRRLQEGEVAAIGFGTGVAHTQVPAALVEECRAAGLPLVEVPYATPFIAVARTTADLVAAHADARRTWELGAYRAMAAAGLRPDPLGSVLGELAEQVQTWVGLCDSTGRLTRQQPGTLGPRTAAELEQAVAEVLGRGVRAVVPVRVRARMFAVWTFGRASRARGALVIEAEQLDAEGRGLVRTAVAMLGIAGESEEVTARAHRRLSRAVLAALLAGQPKIARQMARNAWGGLPKPPVRVVLTAPGHHVSALRRFIDVHGDPARMFLGESDLGVVLLCQDVETVTELAARCGGRYGVSAPTRYDDIAEALDGARLALDRGHAAVSTVEEITPSGVLAVLGPEATLAARATLEPLLTHDTARGSDLVRTVRTWLEHGTEHGATARALGVHRHTVRARIATAERVLGRDLSSFPAQAELWAVLAAAER